MSAIQNFYFLYKDYLEKRFPFRVSGNRFLYLIQCVLVFGFFIVSLLLVSNSKVKFQKTFSQVAGWDVFVVAVFLNAMFSYGFGFFAANRGWWMYFPDSVTGTISFFGAGWMVIEDAIFYVCAVVMGQTALVLTLRLKTPFENTRLDAYLKLLWFAAALAVAVFGVAFGSEVMRYMVFWLYLPFGLLGFLFYHRFTWFQLWTTTALFIVCEFGWDVVARVLGVWIFPDAATMPGVYFKEIVLFHAGRYPVIWQPEMTQMAFISGMSTISFFFLSRMFLRGDTFTARRGGA